MSLTSRRFPRRLALGLGLALASLCPSPVARAGDEPCAEAAPPRLTALELEIRCFDRHLATLRKARTEVAAGRAEPVADDEAEKKSAEADRRSLGEIHRYENARARATHAIEKAEGASGAKDEAKTGEARAAVEALDSEFVAAIKKIDDGRPPKAAPKNEKKADAGRGKGDGGKKDMGN